MRVAVSGASGFIGGYLLAELLQSNIEVVAITRDADRLKGLSDKVRVVEMDITRPGDDCFSKIGHPDLLIHLAWEGLPNYKSMHHFESELPVQYRFISLLVNAGLPNLFVSGTCFEYGMQSGPLSEGVNPSPNNPYGHAKDALRRQLEYLKRVRPFNMIWGRLFYMYGEGQPVSSLYSQLKDAVKRGDRLFNMSGGEQLRDYLPVTEVARRIVRLALSGIDIGTVNICSGKPVSVRRLVEQWLSANDWDIGLNLGHYPYPDYEPMAFWGDAAKMQNILRSSQ